MKWSKLLNKDSGNIRWELYENYDINNHQHDEERWMMSVPWDKHRIRAYHSNVKPPGHLRLAVTPWQWQLSHWMTRWYWGSRSGSAGWGQGRRLLPASQAFYLQQPHLQALKTKEKQAGWDWMLTNPHNFCNEHHERWQAAAQRFLVYCCNK